MCYFVKCMNMKILIFSCFFSDNVTAFSLFVFIVVCHRNYYDIFCSPCVFVTPEGLNKDYSRGESV